MPEAAADLIRQFPLVAILLHVGWWIVRFMEKQHNRELAAKDAEIRRVIEERGREIDRVICERRWIVDKVLKQRDKERKITDGD